MRFRNLALVAAVGLAAGLAVPVMSTPALAATAGSACTLTLVVENGEEEIQGTVSANGGNCVPNDPFSGSLSALNVGVPCGTDIDIADIIVVSDCPN